MLDFSKCGVKKRHLFYNATFNSSDANTFKNTKGWTNGSFTYENAAQKIQFINFLKKLLHQEARVGNGNAWTENEAHEIRASQIRNKSTRSITFLHFFSYYLFSKCKLNLCQRLEYCKSKYQNGSLWAMKLRTVKHPSGRVFKHSNLFPPSWWLVFDKAGLDDRIWQHNLIKSNLFLHTLFRQD